MLATALTFSLPRTPILFIFIFISSPASSIESQLLFKIERTMRDRDNRLNWVSLLDDDNVLHDAREEVSRHYFNN